MLHSRPLPASFFFSPSSLHDFGAQRFLDLSLSLSLLQVGYVLTVSRTTVLHPTALRTLIILLPPSREILLANDSSDRDIGDPLFINKRTDFCEIYPKKSRSNSIKIRKSLNRCNSEDNKLRRTSERSLEARNPAL